jgi:hypothetical protein
MSRIQCLRHHRDFNEAIEGASGRHIVTNVSFDGNAPEAIRLNLASPRSSLRRRLHPRRYFPRNETPFEIHNPSVFLSSDQLTGLQDNFAVIQEALEGLGDRRLSKTPFDDPIHETILPIIQSISYEIAWIDSVLDSLSLDSSLYRSYLRKSRSVSLFDHQVATEQAVMLLDEFKLASELYSQLPELRAYHVLGDVQTDDIGPRGQQFRQWLQSNMTINDGAGIALDYIAYELRPLRIAGRNFQWKMDALPEGMVPQWAAGDLRKVAVDLLLRYQGHPVWCEVKAKGDTWTSSAFQQILFYGSMLSSGNQIRRCHRQFKDEFQSFHPWLGILVEDQDDQMFLADYEQTINFASSQITKNTLKDLFSGIVFAMFRETPDGWMLSRSQFIIW